VVIAGAAGQGRSTTLAAMIGHLNQSYPKHVITIEDPIEHLHEDHRASICQREVGADVEGFTGGLRGARTLDADVIAVSDLRDASAVEAAVEAAEMGRLVIAVVGAPDVGGAVSRLLAGASPARLASVLEGVIAQRLLPKRDGSGVVLAAELVVASGAVRDVVRGGGDLGASLREQMEKGATPYGMQTFEVAMKQLVAQGLVSKASLAS
jgi:twitching motility protein PilT